MAPPPLRILRPTAGLTTPPGHRPLPARGPTVARGQAQPRGPLPLPPLGMVPKGQAALRAVLRARRGTGQGIGPEGPWGRRAPAGAAPGTGGAAPQAWARARKSALRGDALAVPDRAAACAPAGKTGSGSRRQPAMGPLVAATGKGGRHAGRGSRRARRARGTGHRPCGTGASWRKVRAARAGFRPQPSRGLREGGRPASTAPVQEQDAPACGPPVPAPGLTPSPRPSCRSGAAVPGPPGAPDRTGCPSGRRCAACWWPAGRRPRSPRPDGSCAG